MKILDLLSRRQSLQKRLHERTKAREEALEALRILDRLEAELPVAIAAISKRPVVPNLGPNITFEDSVDLDLIRDSNVFMTARAFLAELPQLRRFWEGKLRTAMAEIGSKAA